MKKEHPGYEARNLDVARMYGINVDLCSIHERMRSRKDYPLWLMKKLLDLIDKSNSLIRPLVDHRDELPLFVEDGLEEERGDYTAHFSKLIRTVSKQ